MQIPQSVCELAATGPLAHLTTINPDGSPEVTVVWVVIDNDRTCTSAALVRKAMHTTRGTERSGPCLTLVTERRQPWRLER